MSGIYGEMLLAFPEQFRTVSVYDMTPKHNGGWDIVENSTQTIKGIYQHSGGKKMTDSNGNLVNSSGLELWTSTGGLIGKFTSLEGDVFRLNAYNNWAFEGGFYRYSMEKVVGNNGSESINTTWNPGTNNFG